MFTVILLGMLWILYSIWRRPAPTINEVFSNSNMLNRENSDMFVKNIIMSLEPCAQSMTKQICEQCKNPNRPPQLNTACSDPAILGTCTGV